MLLTNTLAIPPFIPIRTWRTHERAQSVIAETRWTHFPILTFIDIYIEIIRKKKQTQNNTQFYDIHPAKGLHVLAVKV